jgi:hypothetical protein
MGSLVGDVGELCSCKRCLAYQIILVYKRVW